MQKKILIDVERMKYKHTGLYYYCLHLGTWLAKEKRDTEALHFYGPTSLKGIFGNNVIYEKQHDLHKIFYPKTTEFFLWHAVYQGSQYFPKNKKIKKVLTIHDLNFLYDSKKSGSSKKSYLNKLQKRINNSHHVVTISQFVMDEVRKYLDISKIATSVIYCGCNFENTPSLQLPLTSIEGDFLFTIGTIVEKKNFHVLPALLVDNNLKLVLAGVVNDEEYHQKTIAEAIKYKVLDRLIFVGPVSENDKQWYYQNCRAFVFPSIAEGFGLPVIEAMYFGKPVILSTHTSLPEIGGKEAYYFKNFAPKHMQQTLANSLQHYDTTNPSNAIKQRAETFSWQHAAQQYLDVYRSLLNN